MNQSFLSSITPSALKRLIDTLADRQTAAVTSVTEAQGAFLAAQIASMTGKRVLFVLPNDLRAIRAADDAQQLLGTQAACLLAEQKKDEWMEGRMLTPIYLRIPQAERERNARLNEAK